MRDEPVTTREIDNATATKTAPRSACDLPRFVELFSRQAVGFANDARDAIEQRVSRKMRERLRRKSRAMRRVEQFIVRKAELRVGV